MREVVRSESAILRLVSLLLVAMAVVFGITAGLAFERVERDIKTISQDSAPSVMLAGRIREGLVAMDANAVNGFLLGASREDVSEFDDRKDDTVLQLVQAAGNATYGESELASIRALVSGLADYTGYVRASRMMGNPAGIPQQVTASQFLHQQVLPASEALDRTNFGPMVATAHSGGEQVFSLALKVSGWSLVMCLVAVQVGIAIRFRRVFNPALILALLLATVSVWRVDRELDVMQVTLKQAVDNAFASVHALSKASSLAHDFNGDESLYLLTTGDRASQMYFEDAFRQKLSHVISAPVTPRVREQFAEGIVRHEKVAYDGYLADALNNVTFPGEDKLALAAFDALRSYLEVDQRIRDLEQGGQHGKAVELALGNNPGQSNYAFAQVTGALTDLATLNLRVFQRQIDEAKARLRTDKLLSAFPLSAVALLVLLGVRFRIKEFS